MTPARSLHLILVAIGSSGDVHPFVGLGRALKARGHRVTLITGAYFEPLVLQAGLDYVPLGTVEDFHRLIHNPDVWHRFRGFRAVMEGGALPAVEPVFEAIAANYQPGCTVVAASSLAFGSRLAQETLGVPTATLHLQPGIIRSIVDPPALQGMFVPPWLPRSLVKAQYWMADTLVVDRVLCPALGTFRARHGLPPIRRPLAEWIHSPRLTLGLFPSWFAAPAPDWPPQVRLTGFPLYDEDDLAGPSAGLDEFLEAGSPPVVFTPGSAMVHGRDFFVAAVEACRQLGRRGILLTRFVEQVPLPLPDGVRHFDFVPLSRLLPRAAALVYHGGIGTAAQGLRAGIPHLVMPMSHDQPDNAVRLERLGVGSWLPPRRFRGRRVAAALDRLLGSEHVAAACRRVAERFKQQPAPLETTCAALEELAASSPVESHVGL